MTFTILLRRDTAANWTSADPTLGDGEFGYETDTGKAKIGDGATAWTSLAYFPASGGAPSGAAGGALDGTYPNPGIASSVAGNGLAESADVLSVNVDGTTIEISSDSLRIKDAGVTEAKIGLSAVTTNDVTTAKHGFAPTLPNDATKYLDGTGGYTVPSGTSQPSVSPFFGDASDATVAFDGTNTFAFASTTGAAPNLVYTLTRDIYASSVTVSSGKTLITGSYRIFCTGTFTNAGTVHNDGGAASGTTAGTGTVAGVLPKAANGASGLTSGTTTVTGGGGGGAGSATNMVCTGSAGGAGGGANGGAAGGVTSATGFPAWRDAVTVIAGVMEKANAAATTAAQSATMGASGGGGGGGRTTGGTATAGGAGGGGAGVVVIVASVIDNSAGTIRANGGVGSAATGGTCVTGGGGGGGGGAVFLIYKTLTAGTEQALGGAKGTGLNGASAAGDGTTGFVVKIVAA